MEGLAKPTTINILGVEYAITYVDNPADVDPRQREALWGSIDYWTRTIRIYDNGRPIGDIWHTLLHETLHSIAETLKLTSLQNQQNHDDLDVLAVALIDVFVRNKWLTLEANKKNLSTQRTPRAESPKARTRKPKK